jgi:hypothetical protein
MSTVEETAMADKPRTVTLAESDALRALPANRLDPQALISKAIEQGAGIETLERLVQLAKDVREVTAREAWYEAMAKFQQRCPAITKDSSARIQTRSGGSYSYSYASLDTILSIVQPLLGELGLSVSWRQKHEPTAVQASCVVAHRLGHQEESGYISMPYGIDDGRMNPAQRVGSALTYARRYTLVAILGLAPEDDDDAAGTGGRGDTGGASSQTQTSPRQSGGALRAEATAATTDPEAHIAESETLFQPPDAERDHLIIEINSIINRVIKQKRVKPDDVRQWKKTYLGQEDADILKADPAALVDFSKYLLGRFGA